MKIKSPLTPLFQRGELNMGYRKVLNRLLTFTLALSLLASGCTLLGGRRREVPKIEMVVHNPLPVERTDEFVELRVADLKNMAPDFSPNAFIVVQADSNQEVPYQLDDMDNDGEGDEIAMIMDMMPGERKSIVIRYAPEGTPGSRSINLGYERRTRAAMHPEYEGLGWESELIAYRIYPDHRNSIGVFGKQERGLSLDRFAASAADRGYNRLEPWGVSVLDGGKSLGCGGFGLWYGSKLVKPLNIVGLSPEKPDDRVARYTRIIADGPIRSVVQVIFDNWRPDDLGMAVIYPRENFDSFHESVDHAASLFDDESGMYLAVLNPGADNEILYQFMAAWSRGEIGVKKDTQFAELVSSVAQRIRNPLTVTISPGQAPSSRKGTTESRLSLR